MHSLTAALCLRRRAMKSRYHTGTGDMKSNQLKFAYIVGALLVLMALTSGFLLNHTRIGLEFKGGYELNFAVAPLKAGDTLTPKQVLQTANILSERANKLGMSEPQVNILGQNEIRVVLAGVNA